MRETRPAVLVKTTPPAALAVLVVALVAVAVAVAAGGPGREKISFNAADQAAARAVVIKRTDIGPGWRGGTKKPDLSPGPTCPYYHPKQSDLTLTGAAETVWSRGELELDSEGQVLRTARMVRLDWQRSLQAPGVVRCLRTKLTQALGKRARLVSFERIAFPHVATYSAAFRMLADVTSQGKTVRIMLEPILFGRSRTEMTLLVTSSSATSASASAAAVRLARTLAARVRA